MPRPTPRPAPRPKRNRRQRTQAVKDAVAAHGPGPITEHTPDGTVVMADVKVTADDIVEVKVTDPDGGDPHFRIINPPRYVPDPNGDVEIVVGEQVHRFREDPLAALAHVVAQHGGRIKDPRRGLR
jgi:hypothetical protein